MVPALLLFNSPTTVGVTISPGFVSETVVSASGTTTATATASASGGDGSYTYSWSRVSGDSSISAASSSSATTAFDYDFLYEGEFSALFECEVTDGDGFVGSASVLVLLLRGSAYAYDPS